MSDPSQLVILPISFPPGLNRMSTRAAVGMGWYDSHLIRWVQGRLRPISGWELMDLPDLGSPIRALHVWSDNAGSVRLGILCETKLFVLEGPDVTGAGDILRDVTPSDGIKAPPRLRQGGYGNDKYGAGTTPPGNFPNIYGMGQRNYRTDYRSVGEVWRLANWGDDLIAMASPDGRLLRWKPGPDDPDVGPNLAAAVPNAPLGNRTFIVTAERHVMIFAMDGQVNKFGWCSQENIDDWDFASTTNTAGFYTIEPASRIVDAVAAAYSIVFWTVQGAYAVQYKALPYVYTYSYLGQQTAPLSAQSAVAYSGTVMWPAADGFWRFDGSQIQSVPCPILDWFQEQYDPISTRAHMAGWFNGSFSEIWWCFPSTGSMNENDTLIVYNFRESWWSIGKLKRTCGIPGTSNSYPLMASAGQIYRHEKGHFYPGADELPWIRSGAFGLEKGTVIATTRQLIVDTDADLDAVSYEIIATRGRFQGTPEYSGGPRTPATRRYLRAPITDQGKIDYRITGRDFSVKMQMLTSKPWTFGQGLVMVTPRGRRAGI
jgi:hypothetical protein